MKNYLNFIVTNFSEYDTKTEMLNIVMEKGDTDLSTIMKNLSTNGKIESHCLWFYWHCMIKAVQVIHEAGIIHSDLKPANFIFVNGKLKLIDFGIASSIQNDTTSVYKQTVVGTCNYMSPEAIKDNCEMPVASRNNDNKQPCIKVRLLSIKN
ncbi:TTK (predicted) [Pycnogonum litorale]